MSKTERRGYPTRKTLFRHIEGLGIMIASQEGELQRNAYRFEQNKEYLKEKTAQALSYRLALVDVLSIFPHNSTSAIFENIRRAFEKARGPVERSEAPKKL